MASVNMVAFHSEVNQVLQTKLALYDAFGHLLDSCNYNDITVGQICRKAGFSRAVFYNHYHNKEAFLKEIFDRIIELYHQKIARAESEGRLTEELIHVTLLKILMRNKKFFLLLDQEGKTDILVDYLTQEHFSLFHRMAHRNLPEADLYRTYFVRHHALGVCGLYMDWLKQENPMPIEDFTKILTHLYQYQNIKVFVNFMEEL